MIHLNFQKNILIQSKQTKNEFMNTYNWVLFNNKKLYSLEKKL